MLTDQRIEFIRDKVQAFTPAQIQAFNTLLLRLAETNISPLEFHTFTEHIKMEILTKLSPEHQHWARIAPACPSCAARLDLIGISTPKGKANKKGFKSQWICSNPECLYEKFETRPVNELRKNRERIYNNSNRPKNGRNKGE